MSALSDKAAPRPTGVSFPLKGQPVQGLSGIKNLKDGTFLTLSDNGFGSKANSPDAMLTFHVVKPDWKSGTVERVSIVFLSDPDRKVPFRIVNENTPRRYLTGGDFDIESIQPIGEALWFGDEFGPFLIKTDRAGKVLQVFETKVDGKFLYPLLEGPLPTASGEPEAKDGKRFLRILEFDVAKGEYTGKSFKYALEAPNNSIGDFNLIDAEGDLAQADADGFVKKVGYIDLMDIDDPQKIARQGGRDGKLTFPFFTIENVDLVDADRIIVDNDNNLPFSSGRALGKVDDNELILLKVTDLLRAK